MSKKIVIFGSVGVNHGDDLMSRVLVNACTANNAYPAIASICPESITEKYKITSFSSSLTNVLNWIDYIKKADLVLIGGGTLIQNEFGTKKIGGIILYSAIAILISKIIYKKKVVAIGIGINKVNKINKFFAKSFVLCDKVVVRDKASFENSKVLGIEKIEIMPDLGLCYENYDEHTKKNDNNKNEYAAVSLVREDIEKISLELGIEIIEYSKTKGLKVKLIAMDTRDSEELFIYKKLLKIYPEWIDIFVPKTPYEVLNILANSRLVVGMRLHFCILSIVSGKVPLVISREEKLQWIQEYFDKEVILDGRLTNSLHKLNEKLSSDCFIDANLNKNEISKLDRDSNYIKKILDEIINAG